MNGGHDVAKQAAHGGQYPDLKEKSVAYMAGMAGFPTYILSGTAIVSLT